MAWEIRLLPWEFDRLTPMQFEQALAAYRERERRAWLRVASHACWTVAPHLKRSQARKLTPQKLLGLPPTKEQQDAKERRVRQALAARAARKAE